MVDDRLVKHLGVSKFSLKQVEDLLQPAQIKPVANQIELQLCHGTAQAGECLCQKGTAPSTRQT